MTFLVRLRPVPAPFIRVEINRRTRNRQRQLSRWMAMVIETDVDDSPINYIHRLDDGTHLVWGILFISFYFFHLFFFSFFFFWAFFFFYERTKKRRESRIGKEAPTLELYFYRHGRKNGKKKKKKKISCASLHVYDINKKTNVERKKAFRYLICCRVVAYSIYLYLYILFFSKYIRIFTHHLSNFSGRLFLAESFFISR